MYTLNPSEIKIHDDFHLRHSNRFEDLLKHHPVDLDGFYASVIKGSNNSLGNHISWKDHIFYELFEDPSSSERNQSFALKELIHCLLSKGLVSVFYPDGTPRPFEDVLSDTKELLFEYFEDCQDEKPMEDNELMEFLDSFTIKEGAVVL